MLIPVQIACREWCARNDNTYKTHFTCGRLQPDNIQDIQHFICRVVDIGFYAIRNAERWVIFEPFSYITVSVWADKSDHFTALRQVLIRDTEVALSEEVNVQVGQPIIYVWASHLTHRWTNDAGRGQANGSSQAHEAVFTDKTQSFASTCSFLAALPLTFLATIGNPGPRIGMRKNYLFTNNMPLPFLPRSWRSHVLQNNALFLGFVLYSLMALRSHQVFR